jgi:hypothetical protein
MLDDRKKGLEEEYFHRKNQLARRPLGAFARRIALPTGKQDRFPDEAELLHRAELIFAGRGTCFSTFSEGAGGGLETL